jgi:hypothetical protein
MWMNKKRTFLNITIFLNMFLLISCGNLPISPQPEPPSQNSNYQELSETLDKAYEQNSLKTLNSFFTLWSYILPSYTPQDVETFSDTIKTAYKVFIEFYSPTNLFRLTEGRHENFETEFLYIVVQNKLQIAVVDTNPLYYYYKGVSTTEIYLEDFRPPINIPKYPSVYLSEPADSIIFNFLFNPDLTYRTDHTSRVNFLRQAMQLTHHHWIKDYHKVTMPHAFTIILDNSLTKALVSFRVFYQFGDAYLERIGKSWVLISSELWGIE